MVHALRAVILVAFFAWMLADNAIVFSKSPRSAQRADRLSLLVILITTWIALWVGISLAYRGVGVPAQRVAPLQLAGLAVFVCGAAFRWVAIVQLGRFHVPTVAILEGHHLVDTGLYRHIRHPSYLGAILAYLGLGLGLGSWVSAVVIVGVVTVGYLYRIDAEERALIAGLGQAYVEYRRRTRRLIPGVF